MTKLIVGIAGVAGSGKDTIAAQLVKDFGFCRVGFADVMKRFLLEIGVGSYEQLFGASTKRTSLVRKAAQTLGTEWGRTLDDDLWVRYAMKMADTILMSGGSYNSGVGFRPAGVGTRKDWKGVCFSDCRFPNEVRWIQRNGGKVIYVTRESAGLLGAASQHASETALLDAGLDFDATIQNNGTLAELSDAVCTVMSAWSSEANGA